MNDAHYMFQFAHNVQRLSIKDASFGDGNESRQVSQCMLIKMVRRHRNLRWLRSDLTADNIAMLQRERPEMTFVRE
jgi:hypothetical protein